MNHRDLDRHITGNFGEDQYKEHDPTTINELWADAILWECQHELNPAVKPTALRKAIVAALNSKDVVATNPWSAITKDDFTEFDVRKVLGLAGEAKGHGEATG